MYISTEYIDTEYIPTANTKVEFTHIPLSVTHSPWVAFFGCREGTTNINAFYVSSGASNVSAWVGNTQFGGGNKSFTHIIGSTEKITLSSTLFEIEVNNEIILSINNTSTINLTNPNSIYIFSRNIGAEPSYLSKIKFISFKIYENDILVRNFVPAKDSDGAIVLYEKIQNKFYYNLGTGTFTQ